MMMTDYRKLVVEFIGTFTLIFVGAGSIIATQGTNLVAIALAHGIAIAVMVSTFGHVSGGLYNPALAVGLWVTRRMNTPDTVAFIVAQLAGATFGALCLLVLFPEQSRDVTSLGTPVLGGVSFVQGVGIELLLTFFLMAVVFGTAVDGRGPKIGGLYIGLVLTMDIAAGGPLTGASMNPARTFGPALISGTWDDHLVYWIGPIIGAVVAALVYHYVVLEGREEAQA
jgi:MIP family channel proteins